MYVHLGVGNTDTRLVELQLDSFGSIPEHSPVIGGVDPGAYQEIDTGIRQFTQRNNGSGLRQDTFIG